jgi:AcrR family transcriptional regulator
MPRVSADRLEETRARILDGARRAFAREGYEGATVRVLEAETGLSRGAIFHHFPDKDALFLALAEQDAEATAEVVARDGLVGAMRELAARDAGWLGVQVEAARRVRTDPEFAERWRQHLDTVRRAATERIQRQRSQGVVRSDVEPAVLVDFLSLVHDGLVAHLAAGMPATRLDGVLALVESAVRQDSAATPRTRSSR